MATYKYHLRKSKKENSNEGKLFIRVIHDRKVKDIPSHYVLSRSEWDEQNSRIIYHDNDPNRNDALAIIEDHMKNHLFDLEIIVKQIEEKGEYTAEDVVTAFYSYYHNSRNILSYCKKVYEKLMQEGQPRTARAYKSAMRSLVGFRDGKIFEMEEITSSLMRDYEAHLKKENKSMNTISFYMRNLRALYYRAIDERIIRPQVENPFTHVYTGVYVTKKRALKVQDVNAMRKLQVKFSAMMKTESGKRKLKKVSGLQDSIMYFNFCLEARGMSWIDMVYLRKEAIDNKLFSYRRSKTRRELDIVITPAMQEIIDYFSERTKDSPYVFPVINPARGNERRQYETSLRTQNERLEIVAAMADIQKKVTTHVSRHTWATVARDSDIGIPVISELLGHGDINITRIYLDSLDDSSVVKYTDKVSRAFRRAA